MSTFEISNYGVNEMTAVEQTESNGGFIVITIGAVVIGGGLVELALAGIAVGAGIGAACALN